jgi:hypothetical protein
MDGGLREAKPQRQLSGDELGKVFGITRPVAASRWLDILMAVTRAEQLYDPLALDGSAEATVRDHETNRIKQLL